MNLKRYQQNTLDNLEKFLQDLMRTNLEPKYAFMGATEKAYKSEAFGNIPFVCIKIPTGGGKTLVGCYAIEKILKTFLQYKMERGILLWFVPSEVIKTQTLKKFKNKNDSHRKALDDLFENNIKIFSNEEALSIRKGDVSDNLCIVVCSLDAFRKDKSIQNKYKVYQENGALIDHFQFEVDAPYLEKDSEGSIINSLANLVRINNPLIVIDEGHKATSKLSIDFLKDLNPGFVIEYSATPRDESNVLIEVHASELKDEQMVKIPIVLESSAQWQIAVERGLEKRAELEKGSKKIKGEYIRPIALLQAQPKNKDDNSVTVERLKEFLITRKIDPSHIAIKTSEKNELDGIDLFSKECVIRYIITVNALAEGWDCSFAYVLISVANLGSKIAVEQIIGRILRMPYAKKKEIEDYNRSYVFASARNFNEAADQIIGGLESNGYSRADIINGEKKDTVYELEAKKVVKGVLKVPLVSSSDEKLSFEALIGEDFELSKQDPKFDFQIHHDGDGRAVIDIKKDDKWTRSPQMTLKLGYQDKNFTKDELVQWIDKKIRFTLLNKSDKVAFLDKAIEYQLKKFTLIELSVNRFVLVEQLSGFIQNILEKYAKERFDDLLKKRKITTETFEAFPSSITLKQAVPQDFNKNYYEKIDKLNGEEATFIGRLDLDALPNIKYWVRNREKIDPFYIQGWKKGKFYPDFIVVTKADVIVALEWKGEDRLTNEDTEYKKEIGEIWGKLGKGKTKFFLVHNGNIEEILSTLKTLK
jgi:superfamily II DNA or RNA helicase